MYKFFEGLKNEGIFNENVIAMTRMIGDMGLDYYIKDVVVKPEYQHKEIGRKTLWK